MRRFPFSATLLLAFGGSVVVRDYADGRIARFAADGAHAGEERGELCGGSQWDGMVDAEGEDVRAMVVLDEDDRPTIVVSRVVRA